MATIYVPAPSGVSSTTTITDPNTGSTSIEIPGLTLPGPNPSYQEQNGVFYFNGNSGVSNQVGSGNSLTEAIANWTSTWGQFYNPAPTITSPVTNTTTTTGTSPTTGTVASTTDPDQIIADLLDELPALTSSGIATNGTSDSTTPSDQSAAPLLVASGAPAATATGGGSSLGLLLLVLAIGGLYLWWRHKHGGKLLPT